MDLLVGKRRFTRCQLPNSDTIPIADREVVFKLVQAEAELLQRFTAVLETQIERFPSEGLQVFAKHGTLLLEIIEKLRPLVMAQLKYISRSQLVYLVGTGWAFHEHLHCHFQEILKDMRLDPQLTEDHVRRIRFKGSLVKNLRRSEENYNKFFDEAQNCLHPSSSEANRPASPYIDKTRLMTSLTRPFSFMAPLARQRALAEERCSEFAELIILYRAQLEDACAEGNAAAGRYTIPIRESALKLWNLYYLEIEYHDTEEIRTLVSEGKTFLTTCRNIHHIARVELQIYAEPTSAEKAEEYVKLQGERAHTLDILIALKSEFDELRDRLGEEVEARLEASEQGTAY